MPNRFVTDLEFDSTAANTLYVTLSGFDDGTPGQPGHVFKTMNALAAAPAWLNVSPPVDQPQNSIAVDPVDSQVVYLGAELNRHAGAESVLRDHHSHVRRDWNATSSTALSRVLPEVGIFSLQPVDLIAGELPKRQRRLVEAWAELHETELLADWQLLQAGRTPLPIAPLS